MKRECETCIKRKTMYCPNSNECLNTEDMHYYQNRIMLLEENKELKNWKELHSSSALAEENIRIWKTVEKLRNQQKEFIKYLEDEIKHLEHSRYISFNEFGEHKLMFYKEILSKYKEIIGDNTNE